MATEEETGPTLALREKRKALEAELAAMQPPANVITLHPGAVKRYLEMVNDLATSLPQRTVASNEGIPSLCGNSYPASPSRQPREVSPLSPSQDAWLSWSEATCSRPRVVI
jgi:hypothetical protein